MNKFEAVILLSPDLSSTNLKKEEDFFKKHLIELSGSIISEEDWGLRTLRYKIKNFRVNIITKYDIAIISQYSEKLFQKTKFTNISS